MTTKLATLTKGRFVIDGQHRLKACVVTDWSALAHQLSCMPGQGFSIKHRLADVIAERDCSLFVVDTKVDDIAIWPAPLLIEPRMRQRLWVFLLSEPSDALWLNTLPSNCSFLERRTDAVEQLSDLTSYVKKLLDPKGRKRIKDVHYVENVRTFVVRMENGQVYALKVSDTAEADPSSVTGWRIGKNHEYFEVKQESGNWFEVPWDDVLYHCDPDYEYYKGKLGSGSEEDRAGRISGRIRELRTAKGLSITDLADRIGMQRPNLSRLESGRHRPSLETLERIAEALEVPVAQLVVRRN